MDKKKKNENDEISQLLDSFQTNEEDTLEQKMDQFTKNQTRSRVEKHKPEPEIPFQAKKEEQVSLVLQERRWSMRHVQQF